jgi:hypothetical protein
MAKANPSGRGRVDRIRRTPSDPSRQSSGPSTPRGTAPRAGRTPGGEPRQSTWGDHLQPGSRSSSRRYG